MPRTKFTPSGAAATRFSVATSRRWKDKQSEEWRGRDELDQCRCVAVGKLAEYLQKGKQVYVEGRLQTRSYDDKDGKKVYATEVIADEVILLGGQGEGQGAGNGQARAAGAAKGNIFSRGGSSGRVRRHRRQRYSDLNGI